MGEEKKDNIKKIICRGPDNSDDEILSKHNVFILKDNEEPEMRTFDNLEETSEFIFDLLGFDETSSEEEIANYFKDADAKGFVNIYDPSEVGEDKDKEFLHEIETEREKYHLDLFDDDDEFDNENENENDYKPRVTHRGENVLSKGSKLKKAAFITGAVAVAAGGILGGSHLINNAVASSSHQDKDADFDLDEASLEDIIDQLEDNSLAKTEYTKVLNFCDNFNRLASQPDNFRIASADGDNYLEISAEEALYTSIVLNGYNVEEITEICGAKGLDFDQVMKGYESVCEKIRVYDMNAKVASGLESLINDSTAKTFYQSQEKEVIEFNKSVKDDSLDYENSDHVLMISKNNYINMNTVNSLNPAVAHMTSMTINGFADANVNNPECLQYNGTIDGAEGIDNNEKLSDTTSKISDKEYLEKTKEQLKSSIDEYNTKVTATLAESKQELIEALKANGSTELASKVNSRTDLTDLSEQIQQEGGDISDLYNKYQEKIDELNPSKIPTDAIISAIDQATTSGKTGNLEILKNNRVRKAYEKKESKEEIEVLSDDNTNTVINSDNNNRSTNTDNSSTNTKSGSDEVEILDNEEFIDQSSEGIDAAITYANTPGAYKYNGQIQNKYMDEPYTAEEIANMTPSQLWKEMGMAGISMPDASEDQIKEALNKASQGKGESFKEGWLEQIKIEISMSYDQAKESLNDLENMYKNSEQEVELLNEDVAHVQGDNLTKEESSATAMVVDDNEEVEQLNLEDETNQNTATAYVVSDTPTEEYATTDYDIDDAASRLVDANMSYNYENYDYSYDNSIDNSSMTTSAKTR